MNLNDLSWCKLSDSELLEAYKEAAYSSDRSHRNFAFAEMIGRGLTHSGNTHFKIDQFFGALAVLEGAGIVSKDDADKLVSKMSFNFGKCVKCTGKTPLAQLNEMRNPVNSNQFQSLF